jgi:hypothetical protein
VTYRAELSGRALKQMHGLPGSAFDSLIETMADVIDYPDDPLRTFPTSDPYVRRVEFGDAGPAPRRTPRKPRRPRKRRNHGRRRPPALPSQPLRPQRPLLRPPWHHHRRLPPLRAAPRSATKAPATNPASTAVTPITGYQESQVTVKPSPAKTTMGGAGSRPDRRPHQSWTWSSRPGSPRSSTRPPTTRRSGP